MDNYTKDESFNMVRSLTPRRSIEQAPLPSLPNQDSLLKPSNPDTTSSKPSNPDTSSSKPFNTDTTSKPFNPDELTPIFEAFRLHMIGRLPFKPWPKFSLSRAGFGKLEEELRDGNTALNRYAEVEIRYDYIPSRYQLVIRMASNFHEFVNVRLTSEIVAQLQRISTGQSSSANFARNVGLWGSPKIRPLNNYYGTHIPDSSLGHYGTLLPALVIEVSWSQKRKDLPYLADDYLLGSKGNIQAVIGIDLEYKGSEVGISIWKVAITDTSVRVEEVVANEIIRGSVITFTGLRIPLTDFANSSLRAQYKQPITGDVFISATQLRNIVDQAEMHYLGTKSGLHITSFPPGLLELRYEIIPPEELLEVDNERCERTPPEELLEVDDKRFKASEHRALENMDAGSVFVGSTSDSDDSSVPAGNTPDSDDSTSGDVLPRVLRSRAEGASNNA